VKIFRRRILRGKESSSEEFPRRRIIRRRIFAGEESSDKEFS
jgi:hypothetical protein